jgi:predicted nucleic acid-binding protein
MRAYSFLGARDAIHAAVVRTHDLEGIVTADKIFDRVKGVKRFDLR